MEACEPIPSPCESGQGFAAGTWGGAFNPEFGPRDGDVVVLEHWTQSGFANTDLDSQLKQRGIQKIILVGMLANTCSESTARFGMAFTKASTALIVKRSG